MEIDDIETFRWNKNHEPVSTTDLIPELKASKHIKLPIPASDNRIINAWHYKRSEMYYGTKIRILIPSTTLIKYIFGNFPNGNKLQGLIKDDN